jgi:hypothetical protein
VVFLSVIAIIKEAIDYYSFVFYTDIMSPTAFRIGIYRFYFFSREEERKHVHIVSPDGEAKFWLEPIVALCTYSGFSKTQLNKLQKLVEKHKNEITKKWQKHFEA